MGHIGVVEGITKECGGVTLGEYVLLFNQDKIDMDTALQLVSADEFSHYALLVPRSQWVGLFLNEPTHLWRN